VFLNTYCIALFMQRSIAIDGWDVEWANPGVLKTLLDHAKKVDVQPNMIYQTVVDVK